MFELIHTSQTSNFSTASNFSPLVSFECIIVVMPLSSSDIDITEDEIIKLLHQTIVDETTKLTSQSSTRRWRRTEHRSYIEGDCEATHDQLMQNYFSDPCVHPSLVAVDRICCWSDMNKIGFDCYVACSEC